MKSSLIQKRAKKLLIIGLLCFCVATLLIIFLPILVTQRSIISLKVERPNEIGDTIGGIMSPAVGLLAAALTFLAFWAQYVANLEQREQFERTIKETQLTNLKDKVEGRFFELLKVHLENRKEILKLNEYAFEDMVHEYDEIYFTIESYKLTFPEKISDTNIMNLAFVIFFYGPFKKTLTGNQSFQQMGNLVRLYFPNNASTFTTLFFKNLSVREKHMTRKPETIFKGHQEQLGHYYRHLIQTVKYINSQPSDVFGYKDKYDYIKVLRSQLSTYEQILLSYNACSDLGNAWEFNENLSENEKLITKFNLIKNIPVGIKKFPNVQERFPMVYYVYTGAW